MYDFDHDGLTQYLKSDDAKGKAWTEQWFGFVSSFNSKVSPEIISTVLRYGNYKRKDGTNAFNFKGSLKLEEGELQKKFKNLYIKNALFSNEGILQTYKPDTKLFKNKILKEIFECFKKCDQKFLEETYFSGLFEYYKDQPYYQTDYRSLIREDEINKNLYNFIIDIIQNSSDAVAIVKTLLEKSLEERIEILKILIQPDEEKDIDKSVYRKNEKPLIEKGLSEELKKYKLQKFATQVSKVNEYYDNPKALELIMRFLSNDESDLKDIDFDEKKSEDEFKALSLIKVIKNLFVDETDFLKKLYEYDQNKSIGNILGLDFVNIKFTLNKISDLETEINLKNEKIKEIQDELAILKKKYGFYTDLNSLFNLMERDFFLEK